MEKIYDMVIIGGGPGGYTAALYGARAGLATLILEKMAAGGQMALTSQIDNYPGFPEGVDGFELGMRMKQGAERFGAESRSSEVLSVDWKAQPKRIVTDSGAVLGKTVILSTGASPRLLGIPREQELTGRGVSYCAHCDGMFYRGKTVVVVGGGNSAVADALILSRIAAKVILVHRRDALRATKIYHEQLQRAENVKFRWNSAVVQLHDEGKLNAVTVRNLLTGDEDRMDVDGLFVSIGRQPASDLAKGALDMDESGYVIAGESTETNIPGVFAVGDVRTKQLRQIVTAVADGASASHYAEEYLAKLG